MIKKKNRGNFDMYPFHRDQIYCYVHASPGAERDSVTVIAGTGWLCRTLPHYCVQFCSFHPHTNECVGGPRFRPCATTMFRDGVQIGTEMVIGRG